MGLNTFSRARRLWGSQIKHRDGCAGQSTRSVSSEPSAPPGLMDACVDFSSRSLPGSFSRTGCPCHWRTGDYCYQDQCPRAEQDPLCVLPVQRDSWRFSSSITNMLGKKRGLSLPQMPAQSECCTGVAKALSYTKNIQKCFFCFVWLCFVLMVGLVAFVCLFLLLFFRRLSIEDLSH